MLNCCQEHMLLAVGCFAQAPRLSSLSPLLSLTGTLYLPPHTLNTRLPPSTPTWQVDDFARNQTAAKSMLLAVGYFAQTGVQPSLAWVETMFG